MGTACAAGVRRIVREAVARVEYSRSPSLSIAAWSCSRETGSGAGGACADAATQPRSTQRAQTNSNTPAPTKPNSRGFCGLCGCVSFTDLFRERLFIELERELQIGRFVAGERHRIDA